jgi:hypothetical protein
VGKRKAGRLSFFKQVWHIDAFCSISRLESLNEELRLVTTAPEERSMRFRSLLAGWMALVVTTSAPAAVLFDENYTGSNYQALTPAGVVDLAEGNFVYRVLSSPLFTLGSEVGFQFQTRVDGMIFDNGNIGFTFPGEITFIAKVNQLVTNISGNEVTTNLFSPIPSGINGWKLFYDPTPPLGDSDINTGFGFNTGIVILEGYFTSLSHVFDPSNLFTQPGEFLADMAITYFDPLAFQFTTPARATLDGASWFPSQLPPSASIVDGPPGPLDVLGSVDFSMQFVAIPEANTMLLAGLGIMLAGGLSLKRRRSL